MHSPPRCSLVVQEVLEMFWHGFDSYGNYAGWDKDELMPLSCSGHNRLGGMSVTLIDTLDMLAIVGAKVFFFWAFCWFFALTFCSRLSSPQQWTG